MRVRRPAAAAAVAVLTSAGIVVAASPAAAAAQSGRISGDSRIDTAAAISAFQFPAGAEVAYLARADVSADALAAGVLTDGPVLLVPRCGDLPHAVEQELDRLAVTEVVALGGENAVCGELLAEAAVGRASDRLAGMSRYETSVAISRRAFPTTSDEAYIATGANTSPDAVAGGTLTKGPILLVPNNAPVPPAVAAELDRLAPGRLIALGGVAAVSDATLAEAADGRLTGRYAGSSRYETAVAISQAQFADGASRAFIARADVFVDAVAGGSLDLGPILLVPSCGTLPEPVAAELRRLRVTEVYALGGTSAVCDAMLQAAADQGAPGPVLLSDLPVVTTTDVNDAEYGTARMDGLQWDGSLVVDPYYSNPSEIVYDLSRDYARFRTVLGLHDDVDVGVQYRVEVLGDDRSLGIFDLAGPGRQVPVDVDVTGVLRMTLRTTLTSDTYDDALDVVYAVARVLPADARDTPPPPRETVVPAPMSYLYELTAVDSDELDSVEEDVDGPTNGKTYLHSTLLDPYYDNMAIRVTDLQRDFARFRAVVGLHDVNTPPGASYRVSISADGVELWSDDLTLGESHPLDLDVTGKLRLTVTVKRLDTSYDGSLDVVLGSARLLRADATDSAPQPQ